MVFQRFNLFQNMTALANVMSGSQRCAAAETRGARQATELLERVGLEDKAAHTRRSSRAASSSASRSRGRS